MRKTGERVRHPPHPFIFNNIMEQIKNDIFSFKHPLIAFLLCGSLSVGLFHEPASAACSVFLAVLLVIRFRQKKVAFSYGITTAAVALISISYLIVTIWADDKYYAFLGFVKFLPLLLFYLNLSCQQDFDAQKALLFVPYSASVMTIISYIFSKIDATAFLFSVDGRIAGFFQYPNTFALFLIVGIIVIAFQKNMHPFYYVLSAVMVFGIFMSGSRTAFIVFVLVLIALVIVSKNKKMKLVLSAVTVALIIAAVLFLLISNKKGALGRFLSISATSGTLNARLLYMKDALKYILKHPFGIGYMSYYFTQGSFQTGLYTNRFVHNELLQLMLDIGWIPAVAAVVCVVRAFLDKKKPLMLKMILSAILAHAMMDFDLQFLIIGMIALICLEDSLGTKQLTFKKSTKGLIGALMLLVCCAGLYFGTSSLCFLMGKDNAAVKICKHNTMAQIERLNASREVNERAQIAQVVLENNSHISNAYFALADYYYSQGDWVKFSENADKCMYYNRFSNAPYAAVASRLITAAHHFEEQNNEERTRYFTGKLLSLEKRMELANQKVDKLAQYLPEHETLDLGEQTKTEIARLNRQYPQNNDIAYE